MKPFSHKAPLSRYALVLAVYTLVAFHVPFFSHALKLVTGGLNGVLIIGTAALLLLGLDFLLYYVLAWCGRIVGKILISASLVADAAMLFCVNAYDVLVTDEMMGNFWNTQYSEMSGFFSWGLAFYILLLGVLPSVYVFARKVEYGSWKRLLGSMGAAVGILTAAIFGNMKNWPWIDRNSTELGSLIMPWSYIVNTFRYYAAERQRNQQEIPLPDPTAVSDSRDVCVLFIGESVRSDRFSLLGYGRETNRYTAADSVKAYHAVASATYTRAGVKAILEPVDAPELHEILPNYLQRAGVDVWWRTNNWGEPPVHTPRYYTFAQLKERYAAKDFGLYANPDGSMPNCFIMTGDITGGNSGSPVFNGRGELTGLAFDGNWEAMSGDIIFEPDLQRCICVDIRYVLFIIDKFGGAGYLLNEMTLN